MSLLLNHPNAMKKIKNEIDTHVGTHRLLQEDDLDKLTSQDTKIGGYYVSSGIMLMVNVWAILKDPILWDKPNDFMPERFEGKSDDKYKMLAFGVGRRGCPGTSLGYRVLGLTLGTLIQAFEWEKIEDEMMVWSCEAETTWTQFHRHSDVIVVVVSVTPITEDLSLYDNESWNDPRDFAKPVKEISLPQDVLSTSDCRLIELENQVQCLVEAHLAPNPPVQVNKIASSYRYMESLELGKNGSEFIQGEILEKMKDPGLFTLPYSLGNSEPFDTLADLGSCVNLIQLYLFKKLKIGLLEETDHVFGLAYGTKSYPVGIVKNIKVHIGRLKLLDDFYVIDMDKDPATLLWKT
ncbi:MAK10-like protein [Tanacetum coccineum]